MKRLLAIAAALAITACADMAAPADAVRTEGDAIRVAEQVCGPGEIPGLHGHWEARLRGEIWSVGYYVGWDRDECPGISASVRAHDGFVWDGSKYSKPGQSGCTVCTNDRS
jgi:hypothetical protein